MWFKPLCALIVYGGHSFNPKVLHISSCHSINTEECTFATSISLCGWRARWRQAGRQNFTVLFRAERASATDPAGQKGDH